MILADFQNSNSQTKSRNHHTNQNKKQKQSGIKKTHLEQNLHDNTSEISVSIIPEKNIQTFLNQLCILNLKQLYLQNQPKQKKQNNNQRIQQAVKRLTFQQPIQLNKNQSADSQQDQQTKENNKLIFHVAFKKDQKFQKKAQVKVLQIQISQQLKQIKNRAKSCLKPKFIKQFDRIFLKFIIKMAHEQKKHGQLKINQQFEAFCHFYNNLHEQQEQGYMNSIKVQQKIFEQLAHKNILVFDFIKYPLLKDKYFQTFQQLYQFIKKHQNQDISSYFCHVFKSPQNKFQYTVPYENQNLCRGKKQVNIVQDNHDKQDIHFQAFKASKIPKSTYEKPKQRPKSHKQKIQCVPFNFTVNWRQNVDIADYYDWNRQFKAKPIPKAMYSNTNIGQTKQKELARIQRQKSLLQKAHYPQSMRYLQNYDEFKMQKTQQLQQKYKKYNAEQKIAKPIPNFQQLHRKNMHELQTRKQLNQTKTKPKPFNFQQPIKRQNKIQPYCNLNLHKQIQKMPNYKTSPQVQAKSTLKFQGYIQFRKKQKQTKQKQQKRKKKEEAEYEKKKNPYKNILKERVKDQIENAPKAKLYQNKVESSNSHLKIDFQTIYHYKPLLMGSNKNQSKSTTHFSDQFQPII